MSRSSAALLMALMAFPPVGMCAGHDPVRWRVVEPIAPVPGPATARAPAAAGRPAIAPRPRELAPAAPRGRDEAAERAARLGLGGHAALNALLRYGTPRPWLEAVEGDPTDAFAWPVAGGDLFRGFGNTRRERRELMHKGIDIGAPAGTPVSAVADGVVGFVGEQPGYGTTVVIFDARGAVTLFAHLRSTRVVAGQRVRAGQPVGEVGETGITLCPHLHFELRVHGAPRDPMPYFRRTLIQLAAAHAAPAA